MTTSTRARLLAGIVALGLALPGAAQAQQQTLDIPQARVLAEQALTAGRPDIAWALARRLLERDPADTAALRIMAAAAPSIGQAKEGRAAGRTAYRLASTDLHRFEAARLTAKAAFTQKRFGAAKFWLRRARNAARTDTQKTRAARDFQLVRSQSPYRTTLGFSIAPSDNLNGGADGILSEIDGQTAVGILSPDAQALSGVRASLSAGFEYRLSEAYNHRTTFSAFGYANAHKLSSSAEDQLAGVAPEVPGTNDRRIRSGSDLNYTLVRFGIIHEQNDLPNYLPDLYGAQLSQSWYGDDKLASRGALRLGKSVQISDRALLSFGIEGARSRENLTGLITRSHLVDARYSHALASGDRLALTLSVTDTGSRIDNRNNLLYRAGLRYGLARPVGPLNLAFTASLSHRDYNSYTLITPVTGGRQDTEIAAGVEMTFNQIEYFGFRPQVVLDARKTLSNLSRFDTRALGISLGLKSSF